MSSKIVNILRDMYSKIELKIRGDNRAFYSNCGLLQGESTSPFLFSLFVNDLEQSMPNIDLGIDLEHLIIKLMMFADDTVVISRTKEGLQLGLDCLFAYCKRWGITVNINKPKLLYSKRGDELLKLMFGHMAISVYKQ